MALEGVEKRFTRSRSNRILIETNRMQERANCFLAAAVVFGWPKFTAATNTSGCWWANMMSSVGRDKCDKQQQVKRRQSVYYGRRYPTTTTTTTRSDNLSVMLYNRQTFRPARFAKLWLTHTHTHTVRFSEKKMVQSVVDKQWWWWWLWLLLVVRTQRTTHKPVFVVCCATQAPIIARPVIQ